MVSFIKPFNTINLSVICQVIIFSFPALNNTEENAKQTQGQLQVCHHMQTPSHGEQDMLLLSFGLGCGCDRVSILAWPAPWASIWGGRAPWGRGPSTAQGRRWSLLRGIQTLILWWHSVQRQKHVHTLHVLVWLGCDPHKINNKKINKVNLVIS